MGYIKLVPRFINPSYKINFILFCGWGVPPYNPALQDLN